MFKKFLMEILIEMLSFCILASFQSVNFYAFILCFCWAADQLVFFAEARNFQFFSKGNPVEILEEAPF